MATIKHLKALEKQSIDKTGTLIQLNPPQLSKPVKRDDPNFIDEGDLICEVVKCKSGLWETRKINSKLDLFSVTECYSNPTSLAQLGIDTTNLWLNSEGKVVATGQAQVLEETENYGLYKIRIQIQKWK